MTFPHASIKFLRSHPDAQRPLRATKGAAAFDITSVGVTYENGMLVVNTGLRTEFESKYVLMLYGRSGYARKYGLSLANGTAVIDSDYRGDIQLVFRYDMDRLPLPDAFRLLGPGQRVAQAVLLPLPEIVWVEVDSLTDTQRGEGGFGSTGS